LTLLLLVLLVDGGSVNTVPSPFPGLSLSVDVAMQTGFNVTTRAGLPELTLLRGAEGSVPVTVTSTLDSQQNVTVILTLDQQRQLAPPGVTITAQPSSAIVSANGSRTFLFVIRVQGNAPVGAYPLFLEASSPTLGSGTEAFWLVVGPYSPKQSFSLVDPIDYLAKNATSASLWALESDPNPQSPGYFDSLLAQPAGYLTVRSEGPRVDVNLSIANADVPQGVLLTLSQRQVSVSAGAEGGAGIGVTIPFGTPLGNYSFDVLAVHDTEVHVARYSLTILPLPPPNPGNPPNVLVNQTVSGYHFDLYVNYRWGWIGGGMAMGNNASFVYTIIPASSQSTNVTYASVSVVGPNASSGTGSGKVIPVLMMASNVPEQFTLFLGGAGTYKVTVTGYTKGANGTIDMVGSASTSFLVVNPNAQTLNPTVGVPVVPITLLAVLSLLAVTSIVLIGRRMQKTRAKPAKDS
jgi:hypothetical protein